MFLFRIDVNLSTYPESRFLKVYFQGTRRLALTPVNALKKKEKV